MHIFITPLSLQYLVCSHQCWYYRQVTISCNISVPTCSGHLGHVCNSQGKVWESATNRITEPLVGHNWATQATPYTVNTVRRVAGSCNICVECRVMIKLWWYARSGQTKTQPQLSWLNKYLEALFNIVDTDQCYPGWISTSPSCQLRALSTLGHCQNGKCCSISFSSSRSVAPHVFLDPLWKLEMWNVLHSSDEEKLGDEIEQTHSVLKWDAAPNLTHLCLIWSQMMNIFYGFHTSCAAPSFVSSRVCNNTSQAWLLLLLTPHRCCLVSGQFLLPVL